MSLKRTRLVVVLLLLLALLVASSSIIQFNPKSASALGCGGPIGLDGTGLYPSSLKGFVGFEKKTIGPWVKDVYVIEPGTTVSMMFGLALPDFIGNWTFPPYIYLSDVSPYDVTWLSAQYSPNPVVMTPLNDWKVNVTVILDVAKDAPRGEYGISFGVKYANCLLGGAQDFILRVGREKPAHAFTLSYLSSTSNGMSEVKPFPENNRLTGLLVTLAKNSSAKLKLGLSSEYPSTTFFKVQLANMSSRNGNLTTQGLATKIMVNGTRVDTYKEIDAYKDEVRYTVDQHQNGTITLTVASNGDVKEGAYLMLLSTEAYPAPPVFKVLPVETFELPISIWIGKNATAAIDSVTKTMTSTITSATIILSTITETFTKTVSTTSAVTMSTTLTSTTTVTSTRTIADSSIYAWAVGATVIAVVLTVVLLRKDIKPRIEDAEVLYKSSHKDSNFQPRSQSAMHLIGE